jgi:N-methylhydantoinase A
VPHRISVDTGGTFTDVVVLDDERSLHIGKALTATGRAFESIEAALTDIGSEIGRSPQEILENSTEFTYGTTQATNATVEKKTARTAFFTTQGFPDVLLLREGGKPHAFRQLPYPPPYVPRHLTYQIRERIDSEGEPWIPLDESSVLAAIDAARSAGCRAVGVCLIWSIVNPDHETRVGELIAKHWPEAAYTLSHELHPVVREYRRASAAVIDASLKPVMQTLLRDLESDLREAGFRGNIFISTSFGGAWRPEEMIRRPIYSVGSGPSMAPVAGLTYSKAEDSGSEATHDLLVCDTGGTTFDVSLTSQGQIHYTSETWLGGRWIGHITGTRAVDVRSIGAGGGSIVSVDPGGLLRAGPESAGADPGPMCYGRGGRAATVTDAAVVLGYLDGSNFLGGRLPLDTAAARTGFKPIAERLGMSIEEAAHAAMTVATENIVGSIREVTIAQGIDPRELDMVAGGGASGLNAIPIARELGCRRIIVPNTAGALSACGALFADLIAEYPVSRYAETRNMDRAAVNEALAAAEATADEFAASLADLEPEKIHKEFLLDARYRGQVWDIEVPLPLTRVKSDEDVQAIESVFHDTHQRIFAVHEPGQYLECLIWKVRINVTVAEPALSYPVHEVAERSVPTTTLPGYFPEDGWIEVPRFDGDRTGPGDVVDGPAVIREPTTTLVVYPGSRVSVSPLGNYVLDSEVGVSAGVKGTIRQEAQVP